MASFLKSRCTTLLSSQPVGLWMINQKKISWWIVCEVKSSPPSLSHFRFGSQGVNFCQVTGFMCPCEAAAKLLSDSRPRAAATATTTTTLPYKTHSGHCFVWLTYICTQTQTPRDKRQKKNVPVTSTKNKKSAAHFNHLFLIQQYSRVSLSSQIH